MKAKRNSKGKAGESRPWHFSTADLQAMAGARDRWLDHSRPMDGISVEMIRRALNDAMRGAWGQLQWLWEQLEPADPVLAACVDRRLGALKRIPWAIAKKEGLSDAEDLLAEAQLRTLQDFANAIENLDEGIAALAQASFRHYRRLQLLETEEGDLRLNVTDNWNWCRDGYAGAWQWNPAATFGMTRGEPLPVDEACIITRLCPRPIDLPAMMLCLDRKNAKAQWQVYNGRYGTPPVFAIMPPGIDEARRREYLEFACQCVSNAAGVLPAGSDVKTVSPGAGGPDTFSRLIEGSTQELVLRATGGLMTMLTAPGAGTNTATGSAHQDAFDDLAAGEAEEIAALLQQRLFAPALDQWHPGQPHLAEFVMRRPDSDNAAGSVQNIVALANAGYRTDAGQASALTGLQVADAPPAAAGAPLPPALNSLRTRFAPAMLYPPARAAFERAINAAAKAAEESKAAEEKAAAAEPPLAGGELAALAPLQAGRLDGEALNRRAALAYGVLRRAVRPAFRMQEESMNKGSMPEEGETERGNDGGRLLEALLATNAGPGGEDCTAKSVETCRCRPRDWKPITMPDRMEPEAARAKLAKGVKAKNPLGEEVTLDGRLLEHWAKEGKTKKDVDTRLAALPLIEEVVKNPAEIWQNDNGSRTYLASVVDPYRSKGKSYTVAFTQTADHTVLETYYNNERITDNKRTGKKLWPER